MVAQGLAEVSQTKNSGINGLFKKYISALFPFFNEVTVATDDKMKQVMQKEVDKGVIGFTPVSNNVLRNRVREIQVADDTLKKIKDARRKA